jgi:serine/threonine protein kinase
VRSKPKEGMVVAGYRLTRRLGGGGFGQVFLARWRRHRRALKFIPLRDAGEWGRRELSVLVHVRHANVVRLVGHAEWPEEAPEYLVLLMEYVEGQPLYEWAREENPSARQVARVVLKLARALEFLHREGVLHRDLKGDNVLVRAGEQEPVLVDFGSAAWGGAPRITRGALAPGTLHYRSPESVRFFLQPRREPGARYGYTQADELYALGVILYVLLTDGHPFDGPEDLMLGEILGRVPAAPHQLNPRVPRALSQLCMRLLEKEPITRLASAVGLGQALEEVLQGTETTWDMPLFYGWGQEVRTTEDEPARVDAGTPPWLVQWTRQRPRRGKPPAPAASPLSPAAAVAALRWAAERVVDRFWSWDNG